MAQVFYQAHTRSLPGSLTSSVCPAVPQKQLQLDSNAQNGLSFGRSPVPAAAAASAVQPAHNHLPPTSDSYNAGFGTRQAATSFRTAETGNSFGASAINPNITEAQHTSGLFDGSRTAVWFVQQKPAAISKASKRH